MGCDGGTSRVRKKLGIKLEGRGRISSLVQVIFRSDELYERIRTGKGRHYNFVDAAGSTIVAQGCRTEFTLHSSLPPETDFRPVIAGLIGFPCRFEILEVIPWRHNLLIAERYRDGRVFLAGDAVHLVIPTGGLGMNTGVGDAFDLAWKLAGTIMAGRPGLLDAYEGERRPIGARNVEAAGWAAAGVPVWRALVKPVIYDDSPEGGALRKQVAAAFDVNHRRMHGMVGARRATLCRLAADRRRAGQRGRMGDQPIRAEGPARRAHPAYVARRWQALQDILGDEYTLLDLKGMRTASLEEAFRARGAPLVFAVTSRACAASTARGFLLRPDLHIVWRGDGAPTDAAGWRRSPPAGSAANKGSTTVPIGHARCRFPKACTHSSKNHGQGLADVCL